MNKSKHSFSTFLRMLSKKGFYDILIKVKENPGMHYNEILRHSLEKEIVGGRTTVTTGLNTLTDMELLERKISQKGPVRTTYIITKKGGKILKCLRELNMLF